MNNTAEKIEQRIKVLQGKLAEQKRKAEKRRLHYQIVIARSTVLGAMDTEELEMLSKKLKGSPALVKIINSAISETIHYA